MHHLKSSISDYYIGGKCYVSHMALARKRQREFERQEKAFLRTLGKKVAECAAKRGVSIERLAYEAGVSKGYLYDIVKGIGNPTIVILHRIASALDVKVTSLLNP